MPHAPPPNLADAQIIVEVRCRRCAYDLRGLSLEGRCPECGLAIWMSVQHVIDPAASMLPKLRDPIGVGNGLVWLVVCAIASLALLVTHGTMAITGVHPGLPAWLPALDLHADLLLLAAVFPLAALWSVFKFAPAKGDEADVAVRKDLQILGLSLVGWGASALLSWYHMRFMVSALSPTMTDMVVAVSALHMAMALSATAGLHGLRGVLKTIGQRSREYRRAQGGRQGVQPMVAAAVGVAAGNIMRIVGNLWEVAAALDTIGTVLERVCAVMLLIGLGYLLVNAIWIRRALRKPPPRLDDLIRVVRR